MVDKTAIKINQFFVILFSLAAFLMESTNTVLILGCIMLIGAFFPQIALFQQIYHKIIKPLGMIKPELVEETPNPHQFAQAMGGSVLIISGLFILLFELTFIGWALILLVATLALINLVLGFCAGCFIYFQFSKFLQFIHPKNEV